MDGDLSPETIAAWRADVEQHQRDNDKIIAEIISNGVKLDPAGMLNTRVMIMIEMAFGDMDQPARLAYETRVQDMFEQQLKELASKVRQAKLANPGMGVPGQQPPKGGIIIPGRG
jgi:hypothetical protein